MRVLARRFRRTVYWLGRVACESMDAGATLERVMYHHDGGRPYTSPRCWLYVPIPGGIGARARPFKRANLSLPALSHEGSRFS